MTISAWFWIIYVISILFGVWAEWSPTPGDPRVRRVWYVVVYILLGLLGWKAFGSPLQ